MAARHGECRVYNHDAVQDLLDFAAEEETDKMLTLQKDAMLRAKAQNTSTGSLLHDSRKATTSARNNVTTRVSTTSLSSTVSKPHEATNTRKKAATLTDVKSQRNRLRLKALEEEALIREQEIKESVEHTRVKRDEQFNQMYETVYEGMFNPAGVLPYIDRNLEKELAAQHKKKEALYKEWKEQVYDHIHDQIQDKVDGLTAEQINKKHNANYEAFLKISARKCSQNHRGGVFRDVIIQSDYDPLAPLQTTIKISTKNMEDPLKHDLVKVARERREVGAEMADYGPCPGKKLFPVYMYHQPEATPAGHFSLPDGNFKDPPPKLMQTAAKKNHSNVPMEHYRVVRGKAVMQAEYPKGTGMVPPMGHRKDRPCFYKVLHHRQHENPGEKSGDIWLEAKGKMSLPSPGDPNRTTLYPVLNQLADHRVLGGHGDIWMSQKGKMGGIDPNPPAGARDNLFEVVNQSDGRCRAGYTSGDIWLEAKGKGNVVSANTAYNYRLAKDSLVAGCLQDDDGISMLN